MKNNKKLLEKLEAFYKLEEFQVAYYKAQVSESQNEYYRRAFSKMVDIESNHAKYFAEQLTILDIEVPKLTGSLFTLAGSILGESVELTGSLNTLKLGIKLESKAIEMYKIFIEETKDYPVIHNTLWDYLLEEEFHTLWMKDYLDKFREK
ncbi:MAG: ferritin-like domain-containing protein [Peptococcales bacterium]|jgi:bacterioferritin (cytochrome b1)